MSKSKIALKNSIIGFASQITTIIVQFITRSIFIQYLGVEMLGISSTFSSVLNTLSLAELGFHSAIVYNLYRPLADDDKEKINSIINILKLIYRYIGIFFITVGIIFLPFIEYLLKDVEVSSTIYLIFIIQVLNSACSYFLAYKRSLLYADRREFITKIIDTAMNISISILKIVVTIQTSNYVMYISLTVIQTILSNVIVHIACKRLYPFLHKTKFDKRLFREIWSNTKNVFAGKIAYYVYSSTDNLLVSSFVGVTAVGYMVNYTTITGCVKTLANSIFTPIMPILGNMVASEKEKASLEKVCYLYTYVRYIFASIIVIPMIILIQSFIELWIGKVYQLSDIIVILYAFDLYIHFMQGPLCDLISTNGLFKENRNIEIIGAVINISISLVLVNIYGIMGVLLGTAVSQIYFWISRSLLICDKVVPEGKKFLREYWKKNIAYITVFILLTISLKNLYNYIENKYLVVQIFYGGIMCEIIIVITLIVLFYKTYELKRLRKIFGIKIVR